MPIAERRVKDLKLYPSADSTAEWNEVSAAVRNTSFFSACVEDERLLSALQKLVDQAVEEGWSVTSFVEKALVMLEAIRLEPGEKDEKFIQSYDILYDLERLRLVYLTQNQLAAGYRLAVEAFEPFELQAYPAWEFYRQPGAKEQNKRPDHVKHEGFIRLKTDIDFWLARNSPEQGGFGNPFAPWGFNSWMQTNPIPREQAEKLGLIKPGERQEAPPQYAEWNIVETIKQIGSASTAELEPEQQQNVVNRCAEEGITVQNEDNTLQVVPGNDPQDPLNLLSEDAMEDWLKKEMERMEQMSEEEILNEILNGSQ